MASRASMKRRDFLNASTAAVLGATVTASPAMQAGLRDQKSGHATFKFGDLTAVIGDNSADREHRAGYNGVWSLRHKAGTRSVFVPALTGLNLEHIVNGEHLEDGKVFFEPRNAPMSFRQLSDSEAELHQPPTPVFHVESWTRFHLVPPHNLDMHFRCVPHSPDAFTEWRRRKYRPADHRPSLGFSVPRTESRDREGIRFPRAHRTPPPLLTRRAAE